MSPRHDLRADDDAARKLDHLLAGDYLLYELTADREMRVLHLPRPFSSRLTNGGAAAGRASRTAGGGATPAP